MSSLVNMIFQIKRDALFGSDGATSVKRRKILPITETPCTSTTEPAMTEYARPDTSSGGPAGIETPGSSSTCFDVDVTPVSVSTEAQGREAETAFSSLSIVRPGSMALVNDIKKLSADAQTSCLEGFHSTLNHWHPKMVCFSWLGTFCRYSTPKWLQLLLTHAFPGPGQRKGNAI